MVGSLRNFRRSRYHPDFQNRRFSTCMLVYQVSIPPAPAVNSTVSFCRAWISGRSANSTLMPVCFSKSGSSFCMVSPHGFFVNCMKMVLPLNRCQLKASDARATRMTNGPTAAPAAAAAPSRSISRRVIPREATARRFFCIMARSSLSRVNVA